MTITPAKVLKIAPFTIGIGTLSTLVIKGVMGAFSVSWLPAFSYRSLALLSLQATAWPMVALLIGSVVGSLLYPGNEAASDQVCSGVFVIGTAVTVEILGTAAAIPFVLGFVGFFSLMLYFPSVDRFIKGR